ncbi:adenosine kinase [Nematocida sp. LUAm3]|nr:adenosine kinase [Nematocida sp. LUAm3]KAI5175415.1 adenosine kinase [Nematocida sp. LUAm2]KAI5177628.1 adenosine kinase [Nematocida sp. LUAm1]
MPEIKRCVATYPPMLDIITTMQEKDLIDQEIEVNTIIGYSEERHRNIKNKMNESISRKNDEITFVAGGAAFNTQKLLSKWMPCVFFGTVGKDAYGEILEKKMQGTQVEIHLDRSESFSTQWAYVFLSGSERTIIAKQDPQVEYSSAAKNLLSSLIDKNTLFYFVSFSFVLKNIAQDALDLLARKKEVGFCFIVNLSADEICRTYKKSIINVISQCDFVIGNKDEYYALFGEKDEAKLLTWLDSFGVGYVITDGPNEIVGKIPEGPLRRASPPKLTNQSLNTNGAGDSFAAGFISALNNEKGRPHKDILPLIDAGIEVSHSHIQRRRGI